MLRSSAPWWMYVVAVVYVLTFSFNARQEFWGPANGGWIPEPGLFKVASVRPGGPMEKAVYMRAMSWKQPMDTLSMGPATGFWRERILNATAQSSCRCVVVNNTSR